MVNALSNFKKINQTELKTLLIHRLESPEKFVKEPLILWKSYFNDGIILRVLDEVFAGYNKLSADNKKHYHLAYLNVPTGVKYDLSVETIIDENQDSGTRVKKNGLLVVTKDWVTNEPLDPVEADILHSVVNDRAYENIKVMDNLPIFAVFDNPERVGSPDSFCSGEQYVFDPDFDEWANWAVSNNKVDQSAIDFIKRKSSEYGIYSLWYNLFSENKTQGGIITPYLWCMVFNDLDDEMYERGFSKLCELPENVFVSFFVYYPLCLNSNLAKEYYDYVYQNNL